MIKNKVQHRYIFMGKQAHYKFRIFVEKIHQQTVLLKTLNAKLSHIQNVFKASPPSYHQRLAWRRVAQRVGTCLRNTLINSVQRKSISLLHFLSLDTSITSPWRMLQVYHQLTKRSWREKGREPLQHCLGEVDILFYRGKWEAVGSRKSMEFN